MLIEAGKLDRKLQVLVRTATQDELGGTVETWAVTATIWGEKVELRNAEVQREVAKGSASDLKFRVRYNSTINTKMRLRIGDRDFNITGVEEIGRKIGLWIYVSEVLA